MQATRHAAPMATRIAPARKRLAHQYAYRLLVKLERSEPAARLHRQPYDE